jgi:NADH:ubiquinone oxidoreductase subunit 5 (subunit L)/multisubunit Na+/H+ antiporter MnhA subunit
MKNFIKKISVLIAVMMIPIAYLTGVLILYWNYGYTNRPFVEYLLNTNIVIILSYFCVGILAWAFILYFAYMINFFINELLGKPTKPAPKFDVTKHGDFRRYYDRTRKRNYWVLGYFGGGSVNVVDAYEVAKQFSIAVNVPINTVHIDEIFKSRRFKGFKYVYSNVENQIPEKNSDVMNDVWNWLGD